MPAGGGSEESKQQATSPSPGGHLEVLVLLATSNLPGEEGAQCAELSLAGANDDRLEPLLPRRNPRRDRRVHARYLS